MLVASLTDIECFFIEKTDEICEDTPKHAGNRHAILTKVRK